MIRRKTGIAEISMGRFICFTMVFSVGAGIAAGQANTQGSSGQNTAGQSNAAPEQTDVDDQPDPLFPITELNARLPYWLRIGGQFRNRLEGPTGINYTRTRDSY